MERERIRSSNLFSAGHDASGLEVQFHKKGCVQSGGTLCDCGGGDVFHYPGVEEHDFTGLKAAQHPGSYFHHRIKMARDPDGNLKYQARKVP